MSSATQLTLQELKEVEAKLVQTRDLITSKLKEGYLENHKPELLDLFSKNIIGPSDFKQKDRFSRRILAKRFISALHGRGISLYDLMSQEDNPLLRSLMINFGAWLNGYEMLQEGEAFLTWLEKIWNQLHHETKEPPGGSPFTPVIVERKEPPHHYLNVKVVDTDFNCYYCCFGRIPQFNYTIRSDFTGMEFRDCVYLSQAFGLAPRYPKNIRSLTYRGMTLNGNFTFERVESGSTIEASFNTWDPPEERREHVLSD